MTATSEPDVLIVGGGVIGVCCAYYLAQRGRSVTLLEEHDVGGPVASSYGNIGLLVPSHSHPVAAPGVVSRGLRWLFNADSPFYIRPRFDRRLLRWLLEFRRAATAKRAAAAMPVLLRLQRASMELYHELVRELPPAVDFEQTGGLFVYATAAGYERALAAVAHEREAGIEVEVLSTEQLRAREPSVLPDVAGGTFFPEDARVAPAQFVRELATAAERLGATIRNRVTVFRMERSGARVAAVHTSIGTLRPGTVVLAAGSWTPSLAAQVGVRVPIEPAKGYSITVHRPPGCPRVPLHLGEARVVITPLGPDRMRIGGTLELAGLDRSVNLRRLEAIRAALPRYVSGMDDLTIDEIWRGLRPLSSDTLPLLGPARGVENLVLATGHGMIGVSMGPITGKLIAGMVAGEALEPDLELLRADRF